MRVVLRVASSQTLAARAVALGVLVGLALASSTESVPAAVSCPNTAFRVGVSATLSDCRAYEQVSPSDKLGFAAYPTIAPPAQVSSSGEALAYFNFQAFPGAVGNTALSAAHVSIRSDNGWRTSEWTPKVPKAEALTGYTVVYSFSSDLTQTILQIPLLPLTPEAAPYAQNLFHVANGAYSLVNSNPPAVPVEALCELEELPFCWAYIDVSTFAGASSDFSHVLFESNAQFTPNAPPTFTESLYENTAGTVHLVGILPDHAPAATSTAGAGSYTQSTDRSIERAVSPDGSHVIFQAPADGGAPDPAQNGLTEIYDRINGSETIEVSAPAPEATPAVGTPEGATFRTASVDGLRVFFTSSAELTSASNTGEANNSEDLYEYDLKTKQLTDLTIDTNPADASTGTMMQGVVDSSSDGSYVYFVANGQLVEGKGVDGQPNLYMVHNGAKPVFIATLGTEGQCLYIADPCVWSPFPTEREAYVTPGGKHMAFMSSKSLPTVNFPGGYGNIDQETGQADSEVYEYTAPATPAGTGQLLCASCDLTGAQPVGKAIIGGISPQGGEQNGKPTYRSISTPFYRARALSENGQRLFYAAPASIATPYDSVFEYEQNGEGTCEYVRGCQRLISSPSSTEADFFLGASADGSNVFFATSSQLAPSDTDSLRDVYDAHVDGGITAPPSKPPCESGCHQPGTVQPPSSAESLTPGPSENLPLSPLTKRCTRGLALSRGKCVKVKHKKQHKRRGNRKSGSTHKSRRVR